MSEAKSGDQNNKSRRSIKNYILQPFLQVRFGIYAIVSSIVFCAVIFLVLYLNLAKFVEIVLELTGVRDEVKDLLFEFLGPVRDQLLGVMGLYIVGTILFGIKLTHKLVGPTVAFRRHIKMIEDGKFEYRTKLRDGDAFYEVADDLNRLSETLGQRSGASR